jgi:hypothetical protein
MTNSRKGKISELINQIDKAGEELLALADDISKIKSKGAENEVRNAVGSLEYAGVILYRLLNK